MRGKRGAEPADTPTEAPAPPAPAVDMHSMKLDDLDPADLDVDELLRDDP
jgi:hypothetical protein